MYEKIILKKKLPRTVAGTPAAKAFVLKFIALSGFPLLMFFFISKFSEKKQNHFFELDEVPDLHNQKLTKLQEYNSTQDFWNNPVYRGVAKEVLERYYMKDQLFEVGSGVTFEQIKQESNK